MYRMEIHLKDRYSARLCDWHEYSFLSKGENRLKLQSDFIVAVTDAVEKFYLESRPSLKRKWLAEPFAAC